MFVRVHRWAARTRDRMLGFDVADMMYVRHRPEHFRLLQFAFTEEVWGAAPASRRQSAVEAHAPFRPAHLVVIGEAIGAGDPYRPGRSGSARGRGIGRATVSITG